MQLQCTVKVSTLLILLVKGGLDVNKLTSSHTIDFSSAS